MLETLAYVVMLGLWGYAIGRLVAQETVLDPIRRPVFRAIAGTDNAEAIAAMQATGLDPTGIITGWRAYVLDGLSCPSCVGFWATLVGHVFLFDHEGWLNWPVTTDIVIVFAGWAITGICARTFK